MSLTTTHIFLVGFSGSGKTTIGKQLAKKLGWRFVDTDSTIENQAGMAISRIFKTRGEVGFRRLERAVIGQVCRGRRPTVVALGGGAFAFSSNRSLVDDSGVSVWLSCSISEIYRRLNRANDRPLLEVRPKKGQTVRQARLRTISQLLDKRRDAYSLARIRISTSQRTVSQSVSEIMRLLRTRGL